MATRNTIFNYVFISKNWKIVADAAQIEKESTSIRAVLVLFVSSKK